MVSDEQADLIDEFSTIIRQFAGPGRVATALGGSRAKQRADAHSDFDFRLYADEFAADDDLLAPVRKQYHEALERWQSRGYRIDGFWPRKISVVDLAIDRWCAGAAEPDAVEWTVWGYHLPTDIASQTAILDPDSVVAGWHSRLAAYPPAMKEAILRKHAGYLRYWRHDYHYASKVERGDVIFLAGLTARITHSICQILFALNEVYYPGDGWNGACTASLSVAPPRFAERVAEILYPGAGQKGLARQRDELMALIDEVMALHDS